MTESRWWARRDEVTKAGDVRLACRVSDKRFVAQLDRLRELKQFLFEEKVPIKEEDLGAISLGTLNNISYSRAGRIPDDKEWADLDSKLSKLGSYLDDDRRKKMRIRELRAFFSTLPIIFLTVIVLDIFLYNMLYGILPKIFPSLDPKTENPVSPIIYSIMVISWPAALGGLGACAFVGTAAIGMGVGADNRSAGVPASHAVVDIADRNFLRVRLLLGILFGFLIGIPFAWQSLAAIGRWLFAYDPSIPTLQELPTVFIPFLVGFSTNLMFVILSRLIAAIETFFGLTGQKN